MLLSRAIDAPGRAARSRRLAAAGVLLLFVAACAVPRATAPAFESIDSATLPNLRRSQEALADLLAREREHVGALNLQISELRTKEGQLNEEYLESEHDYLLLEDDLASVQEEIVAIQATIKSARHDLEAAKERAEALQAELDAVKIQRDEIDSAITALRQLVARGRVALTSLPPRVRALIVAQMAAAAGTKTVERAPAGVAADEDTHDDRGDGEDGGDGGAGGG